jgi:hypothetical protein
MAFVLLVIFFSIKDGSIFQVKRSASTGTGIQLLCVTAKAVAIFVVALINISLPTGNSHAATAK